MFFGAGLDPLPYMILLGSKYTPNVNRELGFHFFSVFYGGCSEVFDFGDA